MLALRIDLLTGRYVATSHTDRWRAEWPIHPARVFSALVAAYHGESPRQPIEREALEWLETQEAPSIHASNATHRDVVPIFVPVNDPTVLPDYAALLQEVTAAEERLEGLRVTPGGRPRDLTKASREAEKLRANLVKAIAVTLRIDDEGVAPAKTAASVLPEGRLRQPRTFPSVTPQEPVVHLIWPNSEPTLQQREGLGRLVRRLSRIGHSSSLVGCTLVDESPIPNWVPDEQRTEEVLRWVSAGQLRRLEDEFLRHREAQPRVLPSRAQRYRRSTGASEPSPPRGPLGDDWIVFRRTSGPRLPGRRSPDLAAALRDALMACAEQPVSGVLSGHAADGSKLDQPHAALVALPNVGSPHADGTILGVAIILPREISEDDRRHIARAVGGLEAKGADPQDGSPPFVRLWRGLGVDLVVQRQEASLSVPALRNLDPRTWTRRACRWATVTPIALDRNPGDLRSRQPHAAAKAVLSAEETVARACELIGLPRPACVTVTLTPGVRGTEAVYAYRPWPSKTGRLRRVLVHADILFECEIEGPVLLGAGRYTGLGLCRPVE